MARHPGRRRQHLRDAGLAAAAGLRRRPRRAFHDQVPGRPLRRDRRGGLDRQRGRSSRSSSSFKTPSARCRGRWTAFWSLRGTKTLPIRMERHCRNAGNWPRTFWPIPRWDRSTTRDFHHPKHDNSPKRRCGFGGMISFELKGGPGSRPADDLDATKIFAWPRAWAAVESLDRPSADDDPWVHPARRKDQERPGRRLDPPVGGHRGRRRLERRPRPGHP